MLIIINGCVTGLKILVEMDLPSVETIVHGISLHLNDISAHDYSLKRNNINQTLITDSNLRKIRRNPPKIRK